jgi:AraC family transcriptional regulator
MVLTMTGLSETQQVSVLLIADEKNPGYFPSLDLKGEKVERCPFKDCVDSINRWKADVMMLDCGYQVGSGLSALRQIKQARPDVPIIFLTDLGSEDSAVSAVKLGAEQYFKKPVKVSELRRLLERLLSARHHDSTISITPAATPPQDVISPPVKADTADKPQNILQVISFIESNLWSPLELEGLAQKANLSKFHFCRIFKRYTGMNPMKFVNALRIERSKELLAGSTKSVSLLANEVGFRDLSNFIRQFKKVTGVTPTTYRDMSKTQKNPVATAIGPPTIKQELE